MPKFRKKPVVIEATQFFKGMGAYPDGICLCAVIIDGQSTPGSPHIHTLEGSHRVNDGDWIITGVAGEKYPCKDSIFQATYDPIDFDGKRPTIDELEKILAQNPDSVVIQMNPDGSISAVPKSLDCVATEGGKVSTQTLKPYSY